MHPVGLRRKFLKQHPLPTRGRLDRPCFRILANHAVPRVKKHPHDLVARAERVQLRPVGGVFERIVGSVVGTPPQETLHVAAVVVVFPRELEAERHLLGEKAALQPGPFGGRHRRVDGDHGRRGSGEAGEHKQRHRREKAVRSLGSEVHRRVTGFEHDLAARVPRTRAANACDLESVARERDASAAPATLGLFTHRAGSSWSQRSTSAVTRGLLKWAGDGTIPPPADLNAPRTLETMRSSACGAFHVVVTWLPTEARVVFIEALNIRSPR